MKNDYGINFDLRGRDSGQPRRVVRAGGRRIVWLTMNGPNIATGIQFLEELCSIKDLDLRHWRRPIVHAEVGSEASPHPNPEANKPQDEEEDEEEDEQEDEPPTESDSSDQEDANDQRDDMPPPAQPGGDEPRAAGSRRTYY